MSAVAPESTWHSLALIHPLSGAAAGHPLAIKPKPTTLTTIAMPLPYPTDIQRTDDRRLMITWSDGMRRAATFREIQESCPCATCREKRKQPASPASPLMVISPEETQPLQLQSMKPVGSYAYHIEFNYGCTSGIYTFELLRELGEPLPVSEN